MRPESLLTTALIALLTTGTAALAESQVTIQSVQLQMAQADGGAVKSETLKFEPFKGDVAQGQRLYTGRSAYRDTGHDAYHRKAAHVGFATTAPRMMRERGYGRGYADLVGDSESGVGFYPLPRAYREGAVRYRWTHRYAYGPYGNPVQQAVIADAVRTGAFTPASAVNGYRYGVFDPIDGVGTPFFAGYYSAGTRDASDGPEPIFGYPIE